jgi:pseudaminic acid biosynthesis-associated methylase
MHKTVQEEFWAGKFGEDYIARNIGDIRTAAKINLFSKVLNRTQNVGSVLEFGANIGLNLIALKTLHPELKMTGIEINSKACEEMRKLPDTEVFEGSIYDYPVTKTFDMTLIKTVLIHINPEYLDKVYQLLYNASSKYICIVEYYNPSPVVVNYRGHDERLFKRDFAGEMLEKYKDLKLVDYGFIYKRDNQFPLDDVTWFLMEKTSK